MDPREVLERHTEEVWNGGDLDAVETYIAEDYVEADPSVHDRIEGPEAYRENVAAFREAFPDLEVTIEDSVVEGEKIAMRQRWTGTHEGEFAGLEPTGREVDATSFLICRVVDDQIVETWVETDMLDVLQQLGVDLP